MGLLFTVTVPDEPAVVRDRLAAALTTKAPGWFGDRHTFRRLNSYDGFFITRNFLWSERSLPIVAEVRFHPVDGAGTMVAVTTRWDLPSWVYVGFACLWSVGWLVAIFYRIFVSPRPHGVHWGEIAVFGGMALAGWITVLLWTDYEKELYRHALEQILKPGTDSFKLPA